MVFMQSFPRVLGALVTSAVLLLAAACGPTGPGATAPQPGQLSIVVSFYPFQFIAERVAGPHARVESLTQPGAEPHDLELTPQQIAKVGEANLVVYEKTFQPAVDEAVGQSNNANILESSTVVPMQPIAAGHDDHEGADEHSGLDPHIWLDPINVATIAKAVAEKLAAIDPDHAQDYTSNAEQLGAELTGLDQEFSSGLKTCQRTEFITSHEAFGYLAKRYGLTQISIGGLSTDAEPSPARIAEVHTEAKEYKITTIFYETLVSPAVSKAIAGDLGLKTDVLDPLEGITADSRGKDYLEVMRANLTALRTANECQ
jgi:zinc transport system substrate-binding protein